MNRSSDNRSCSASFAQQPFEELVKNFNAGVGNQGCTSARAEHDTALIDKLVRRRVNVSAVYDDRVISFAHHSVFDSTSNAMASLIDNLLIPHRAQVVLCVDVCLLQSPLQLRRSATWLHYSLNIKKNVYDDRPIFYLRQICH